MLTLVEEGAVGSAGEQVAAGGGGAGPSRESFFFTVSWLFSWLGKSSRDMLLSFFSLLSSSPLGLARGPSPPAFLGLFEWDLRLEG